MAWLTALDHQIFFAIHHLQKFHLDFLLAWPTYLGRLWFALLLLAILTCVRSREKLFPRLTVTLLPVALAWLSAEIIKPLFARPRPFTFFENDPGAVHILFNPPASFSFPSGHATTAFATAVILSSWFGVPRIVAYGLAILVCLTRLYVGVHFPSDVMVGALWGFSIAWTWVRILQVRGLYKHSS